MSQSFKNGYKVSMNQIERVGKSSNDQMSNEEMLQAMAAESKAEAKVFKVSANQAQPNDLQSEFENAEEMKRMQK